MLSLETAIVACIIGLVFAVCASGVVVALICGFRGSDSVFYGFAIVWFSIRAMHIIVKDNHREKGLKEAFKWDIKLYSSMPLFLAWSCELLYENYVEQYAKQRYRGSRRIKVLRENMLVNDIVEEAMKKLMLA